MRILAQIGLHDFGYRMANGIDLSEHLQDAVLHLLYRIGNAVRPVHLDCAGVLIYGELVPFQAELFVGEREVLDHRVLGFRADVVVAGVVPAADVQSGNVLAGLKGRIGVRTQPCAVEMICVRRSLACVVEVRNAVPQTVAFAHGDVVHLNGEITVEAGLPAAAVDVFGDRKQVGALVCVFDRVQAGILH